MQHTLDAVLADHSAAIDAGLPAAELIDRITEFENAKRRIAALELQAIAAYAEQSRAADAHRGTSKEKTSAAICREIALARKCSPRAGNTWLGVADALAEEMPETRKALEDGRIDELTARDVVGETAHISVEDRLTVDATLVKELRSPGVSGWRISSSARALADEIDPAAAVERRKKAEGTRRAAIRPCHDSLAALTLTGPIADTVSCDAALGAGVRQHRSDLPDDERTDSQLRYDLAVERLTGRQIVTDPVPVQLHLVMTEEAMFRDGNQAASVLGHGPIAARHARELVLDATERDLAFIRRLYTRPDGADLVAMDSRQRSFPEGLARFLRARDKRCATPYCDAPIRHSDHVTPWSGGGPTSIANGQGLCRSCNYVKDLAGFRSTRDDQTGVTTFTTRTGHRYDSAPPPVLGHPVLPDRRAPRDRRSGGRRSFDLTA